MGKVAAVPGLPSLPLKRDSLLIKGEEGELGLKMQELEAEGLSHLWEPRPVPYNQSAVTWTCGSSRSRCLRGSRHRSTG